MKPLYIFSISIISISSATAQLSPRQLRLAEEFSYQSEATDSHSLPGFKHGEARADRKVDEKLAKAIISKLLHPKTSMGERDALLKQLKELQGAQALFTKAVEEKISDKNYKTPYFLFYLLSEHIDVFETSPAITEYLEKIARSDAKVQYDEKKNEVKESFPAGLQGTAACMLIDLGENDRAIAIIKEKQEKGINFCSDKLASLGAKAYELIDAAIKNSEKDDSYEKNGAHEINKIATSIAALGSAGHEYAPKLRDCIDVVGTNTPLS